MSRLLISALFIAFYFNVAAQDDNAVMLDLNQIIDSALLNHPEIKNSDLRVSEAQAISFFDFKPTELNYENGQRFSDINDSRFDIHQNFGSPFLWKANSNQKQHTVDSKKAEAELTRAKIIGNIKAAYYQCLYELNKIELYKKQKEVYYDITSVIDTNSAKADTFLIEKEISDISFSNVLNESELAYNDYYLAKNQLNKACLIKSEYEVKYSPLIMFSMIPPTDTFNRTPANLYFNLYKNYSTIANDKLKIEKLKYLPEISAGYFNQSIYNHGSFKGWQIGVNVPILFFNQQSKIKQASANRLIAENEIEMQKQYTINAAENLLIKLNKYFEQLNYYYDYALKQADILENSSLKIIKSNPSMFIKCLEGINSAYRIKMDYLKVLNEYNQTAIELELYAY
jgi:cobalt-zinc-cadmium resistance protein CzcA